MNETATNYSLKPRAQDHAWSTLVTISTALPQGLILVGPAGVGKRRAAKALYQLLHCSARSDASTMAAEDSLFASPAKEVEPTDASVNADSPCGVCTSCRKIAEGRHADLIEILPRGENIAVDDMRDLKKTLFFSPIEGKVRFVLIDEAHKLNASSANTLLKTLEEPPAHTRFFLITHERGILLPTITSRCQFVHFRPLDDETIKELLAKNQHEIPDRLLRTCLTLLGGGLERAPMLANEKALAFIESVQRAMVSPSPRWEDIVQLSDQLGGAATAATAATHGSPAISDDWKLEILLDLILISGHRSALASRNHAEATRFVNRALEAAYLRRRLDRHANKKLIALSAANLTLEAR